ncbi:hypothetical protein EV421DRAFT_1913648 [Armillaria borealis]|uniref:Uncharacterized protein n=1 Tax=Armillaria borealis TaxID=47425 RepID=A0AA39MD75_9AGAR|nr:hypothetical protein EV421DRAFT_1913648 [Armillaria borealis]
MTISVYKSWRSSANSVSNVPEANPQSTRHINNLFMKEVIKVWAKTNEIVPEMSYDIKLNGSKAIKVLVMFFKAEVKDLQ